MVQPVPGLETLGRIAAQLDAVEAALQALDNDSYGLCATCGASIAGGDLAADPLATDCGHHHGGEGLHPGEDHAGEDHAGTPGG